MNPNTHLDYRDCDQFVHDPDDDDQHNNKNDDDDQYNLCPVVNGLPIGQRPELHH
jgi:hypothetical protein